MSYLLHLVVLFEIYILVATSLNLLIGYGGLIQLAQAAYFGIGAYTTAIVSVELGWGFVLATFLAGCTAGVLSVVISVPAWRFRGDALVIISLSVQLVFYALFCNWVSITGGPYGITAIPKPVIFSTSIDTPLTFSLLYAFIVACFLTMLALLQSSPFGRALQAMRDDDLAACSIGISTQRLKVQVFAIASALVGVGGAMYAAYSGYIDPTSFTLDESIVMLSMVIVGGTGNLRGPLVGALILIAIPEVLRTTPVPISMASNIRLLLYGILMILLMHLRPRGLVGRYRFE